MADEARSAREQALQYAARLQGLTLIRTGETYALADIKLAGATLDQVASFLSADGAVPDAQPQTHRRSDLQALLKAEHAMRAELDAQKHTSQQPTDERAATEAALAEIRRRIAEIAEERRESAAGRPPLRP
jgi:hypothetical protein